LGSEAKVDAIGSAGECDKAETSDIEVDVSETSPKSLDFEVDGAEGRLK